MLNLITSLCHAAWPWGRALAKGSKGERGTIPRQTTESKQAMVVGDSLIARG